MYRLIVEHSTQQKRRSGGTGVALEHPRLVAHALFVGVFLLDATCLTQRAGQLSLGLLVLQHGLATAPIEEEVEELLTLRTLKQLHVTAEAQVPRHIPNDHADMTPQHLFARATIRPLDTRPMGALSGEENDSNLKIVEDGLSGRLGQILGRLLDVAQVDLAQVLVSDQSASSPRLRNGVVDV
jgi:hypothetical protein